MKTFNFSSKILPQLDFAKFSWFFCYVYFFTILRKYFPVIFTQPYSEERLRERPLVFKISVVLALKPALKSQFIFVNKLREKEVWNCGVLSKFKSKSNLQKWPLPMELFLRFVMEKRSNLQLCRYFLV